MRVTASSTNETILTLTSANKMMATTPPNSVF